MLPHKSNEFSETQIMEFTGPIYLDPALVEKGQQKFLYTDMHKKIGIK